MLARAAMRVASRSVIDDHNTYGITVPARRKKRVMPITVRLFMSETLCAHILLVYVLLSLIAHLAPFCPAPPPLPLWALCFILAPSKRPRSLVGTPARSFFLTPVAPPPQRPVSIEILSSLAHRRTIGTKSKSKSNFARSRS